MQPPSPIRPLTVRVRAPGARPDEPALRSPGPLLSPPFDCANQSLTEMMLPAAVHDHPRHERAGPVLDVRQPLSHRPPLLRGIGSATFGARGRPIVRGRFFPDK